MSINAWRLKSKLLLAAIIRGRSAISSSAISKAPRRRIYLARKGCAGTLKTASNDARALRFPGCCLGG